MFILEGRTKSRRGEVTLGGRVQSLKERGGGIWVLIMILTWVVTTACVVCENRVTQLYCVEFSIYTLYDIF